MSELTAEIKKYAVRIKSKDIILGSGVLWKAKLSKKNKLYVFTAAHVIKNRKNIVVEFWHDDRKMRSLMNGRLLTENMLEIQVQTK